METMNRLDYIAQAAAKRNKFGSKKVRIDGTLFDSQWEAKVYQELKLLERCARISDLKTQVPFPLNVKGKQVGKYIADFVYQENGETVVADAKGFETALFKWKKKHFEIEYETTIQLIKKGTAQ